MNALTTKITSFAKGIWERHKIPVILVAILVVASMTAMCASC